MKRKTAYGEDVPDSAKDTGRMGFRWPEEPPDGRPVIDQRPFWRDRSEQLTYEHAVETNPRRVGEGPISYLERITALVSSRQKARLPPPAKPMPKAVSAEVQRMSQEEIEARIAALEGQREASK